MNARVYLERLVSRDEGTWTKIKASIRDLDSDRGFHNPKYFYPSLDKFWYKHRESVCVRTSLCPKGFYIWQYRKIAKNMSMFHLNIPNRYCRHFVYIYPSYPAGRNKITWFVCSFMTWIYLFTFEGFTQCGWNLRSILMWNPIINIIAIHLNDALSCIIHEFTPRVLCHFYNTRFNSISGPTAGKRVLMSYIDTQVYKPAGGITTLPVQSI